jgi:hypothetical protein
MSDGTGMSRETTYAECLTLFPAHQEEHVLLLTPRPWECNYEGEEVSNYLDMNITMTEKQDLRGNENYRLLGKRMGLAGRKPQ